MKYALKYLVYALPVAGLLGLGSCEKKLDEAFPNPNAQIKQPIETLLPGILSNFAIQHSANGTLYGPQNDGLYIGRFIQNWATNTTLNQYDQMGDNFINKSDIMGSIWASHYYGMGQNVNRVIEWGTEEEKWDYVGVAQAVRAWSWLTLTDLHDDVILYEAFRPELLVFKYDPQAEVYEEIKRLCNAALANLSRTDGNVSQANLAIGDAFMNEGDVEKWKKFVYGVLARTYNRTSNKSSYQPDSVIYFAERGPQTNADNTDYTWSNAGGTGTYSYWSPFRGNVGTLRQTKFIADLMQGVNARFPRGGEVDPRAPYIIRENPAGTYTGTRPNKGTDGLPANLQPHNFWGGLFSSTAAPSSDATSRYVFTNKPIFPIITAAEMKFLIAEANMRKGLKAAARQAYVDAITLHFDELIQNYETNVPPTLRITPATRTGFMNNPINIPAANDLTLSHIMMQKYVAMYAWGVVETWVDLRRYHYTDLDPQTNEQVYREFQPPTGLDLYTRNNGKWIYRHRPRYNSEYLYNIAELMRLGAFDVDYITKEQWFSKP